MNFFTDIWELHNAAMDSGVNYVHVMHLLHEGRKE